MTRGVERARATEGADHRRLAPAQKGHGARPSRSPATGSLSSRRIAAGSAQQSPRRSRLGLARLGLAWLGLARLGLAWLDSASASASSARSSETNKKEKARSARAVPGLFEDCKVVDCAGRLPQSGRTGASSQAEVAVSSSRIRRPGGGRRHRSSSRLPRPCP